MKELISLRFTAGDKEELKVVLTRKPTETLVLPGERFVQRRENSEQKRPQRLREGSELDIMASY